MPSPILADLDTQVTNATTVMAGAKLLLNGIAARVQAAVDAALANGATAAELQPVSVLATALKTSADDLSSAMVENTPAANLPA